MRSPAIPANEPTPVPETTGRPDLVRLSLALLGAEAVEPMHVAALRVLSESSGRKNWALLTRVSGRRYRATLRGSAGVEDLLRLTAGASGRQTWLSLDRPVARDRRLGEPAWAAARIDRTGGDQTPPDLILAYWPPRESASEPREDEPTWLEGAADLLAAATHGVKRLEELKRRSCHDPLTGLLNRRGLEELLERERSRLRRAGSSLSVIYLDLNRFKQINDRLGHAVGDDVLRAVADRLRSEIRGSDALARLGGDEFLVLLPDAPVTDARRIARRLRAVLERRPLPTSSGPLPLRVSCGVSGSDEEPFDGDLIDRADRRMLRNKKRHPLPVETRRPAEVAVMSPS